MRKDPGAGGQVQVEQPRPVDEHGLVELLGEAQLQHAVAQAGGDPRVTLGAGLAFTDYF